MDVKLSLPDTPRETTKDVLGIKVTAPSGAEYSIVEYEGHLKIMKTEGGNMIIVPSSNNAIELL